MLCHHVFVAGCSDNAIGFLDELLDFDFDAASFDSIVKVFDVLIDDVTVRKENEVNSLQCLFPYDFNGS
jgi:hypothetical protein